MQLLCLAIPENELAFLVRADSSPLPFIAPKASTWLNQNFNGQLLDFLFSYPLLTRTSVDCKTSGGTKSQAHLYLDHNFTLHRTLFWNLKEANKLPNYSNPYQSFNVCLDEKEWAYSLATVLSFSFSLSMWDYLIWAPVENFSRNLHNVVQRSDWFVNATK